MQEEEDRQANPNVEIEEDPWKADVDLPVPLHEPDLAPDEDHSDLEEELFEDPLE